VLADLTEPEVAKAQPPRLGLMRCYPVSTRVNHAANDDPECSSPVQLSQTQNRLFS